MVGVQDISSEDEYKTVLSSLAKGALVTIFFHTPWAAPCTQMRTFFETLASQYPAESNTAAFLAIDAEALPDISEAFDVTAVPFIVLAKDGSTIDSISGSSPAKVRDAVEREIGPGTSGSTRQTIPEKLSVTPQQHSNDNLASGTVAAGQTLGNKETEPNGAGADPTDEAPMSQEDLDKRLGDLVKAAPVMLFMKGTPSSPQCGFSRQIVAILRERGVRYGFFNILADEEVRQGMKTFADWPTFPQLWVGGELVGGLDIVKEELESNPAFFAEYSISQNQKTSNAPATASIDSAAQQTAAA